MKKVSGKKFTRAQQAKLVAALDKQNLRAVKIFLMQGWNPAELLNGENPVNYCDSVDFAKLLINAGADVNAAKDNWTPILLNSDVGKEDMVALLIMSGADVNRAYSRRNCSQIPFGTTPLMKAAGHGYLKIVRSLLAAGADVNAADEYGHNALFWALRWDKAETAKELLRRGSNLSEDVLCGPVKHGNVELVKLLIGKGANVNCVFRKYEADKTWPDGETLLGYATARVGTLAYPMKIIELLV